MLISLLEVFPEWGVRGGDLGFLTKDLEDMVISDVMDDLTLPNAFLFRVWILIPPFFKKRTFCKQKIYLCFQNMGTDFDPIQFHLV